MKKTLLGAVAAILLAFPASHAAFGQTADAAAQVQQYEADRATLIEARIAAIKSGLNLTAAQEKNWAGLEKVAREVIAARAERQKAAMKEAAAFRDKDDVVSGMKLAAADLIARGQELQKVADAAAPLFASLDPEQKHRFAVLLHSFAPATQQ